MVINVIELYDTSHGFRTPQGLILIQKILKLWLL